MINTPEYNEHLRAARKLHDNTYFPRTASDRVEFFDADKALAISEVSAAHDELIRQFAESELIKEKMIRKFVEAGDSITGQTRSPTLWAQQMGRGTRPHHNKPFAVITHVGPKKRPEWVGPVVGGALYTISVIGLVWLMMRAAGA